MTKEFAADTGSIVSLSSRRSNRPAHMSDLNDLPQSLFSQERHAARQRGQNAAECISTLPLPDMLAAPMDNRIAALHRGADLTHTHFPLDSIAKGVMPVPESFMAPDDNITAMKKDIVQTYGGRLAVEMAETEAAIHRYILTLRTLPRLLAFQTREGRQIANQVSNKCRDLQRLPEEFQQEALEKFDAIGRMPIADNDPDHSPYFEYPDHGGEAYRAVFEEANTALGYMPTRKQIFDDLRALGSRFEAIVESKPCSEFTELADQLENQLERIAVMRDHGIPEFKKFPLTKTEEVVQRNYFSSTLPNVLEEMRGSLEETVGAVGELAHRYADNMQSPTAANELLRSSILFLGDYGRQLSETLEERTLSQAVSRQGR